ncbi:thioredoxin-like protein [Abortiporus biennis]|nr:thioredoxin-like protein [Abortiporus biennis]
MQEPRVIKLLVFSDIICPWCYIGQREMDKAIEQCSDYPLKFEIEYRPYKLQPSLKEDQVISKREWFESRFGKEKTESMNSMVSSRGEQVGINFKLTDGVITQTTKAHRLLLKAWKLGGQDLQLPLLHALFKGYFEQSKNLGDIASLAGVAAEVGVMSHDEAVKFLESDECQAEVEQMMIEVRKKGVTGVPFVVIDGRWAVSGGHSADTYVQVRGCCLRH